MEFKFLRGYVKLNTPHNDPAGHPGVPGIVPRHFNMPIAYEPMRQNRYLVYFPEEYEIQPWMVKSTSRPTVRRTNVGLMEWDDIEFKFYDPIGPSTQQLLYNLVRGDNGFHNRIEIKIQMIDPVGMVVSEWIVYGFIKEINFGELNYMSDEMTETTLVFGIDNAVLNF